jgi:hypothetical protein
MAKHFPHRTPRFEKTTSSTLQRQKPGRRTTAKPGKDIREMMKLTDKLTEGWHKVTFTRTGSVKVETGDGMTVSEAIDDVSLRGYLSDWSVDDQ